jgi:hypothetical protein
MLQRLWIFSLLSAMPAAVFAADALTAPSTQASSQPATQQAGWSEPVDGLRCRLDLPATAYFGESLDLRGVLKLSGEQPRAVPFSSRQIRVEPPAGEPPPEAPLIRRRPRATLPSVSSRRRVVADLDYGTLEMRSPTGQHFIYDPRGNSRNAVTKRPPQTWDIHEVAPDAGMPIEFGTIYLCSSGSHWIDAATHKPATFSFKTAGDFEFRLIYSVPQSDAKSRGGTPSWSGELRSEWTRVRIAPLPPEQRRMEITAEERAAIEAGDYSKFSAAIHVAANEGLAIALIEAAKKDLGKAGAIMELVSRRAIPRPELDDALAIDGPYLGKYIEFLFDLGTSQYPTYPDPAQAGKGHIAPFDDLFRPAVLYVLAHPKDRHVVERIEWFAFNRANLWPDFPPGKPVDAALRRLVSATRLSQPIAWSILLELKYLRPGMDDKALGRMLGDPTIVRGDDLIWVETTDTSIRRAMFVTMKEGKSERITIRDIRWQESPK